MRTRRNKDEIPCTGCGALTESVSCHPITKTGSYCDTCTAQNESAQPLLPVSEKPHSFLSLTNILAQRKQVDIRGGDGEPVYAHQVARDATTLRRSVLCTNSECDIKLPGHSHKI